MYSIKMRVFCSGKANPCTHGSVYLIAGRGGEALMGCVSSDRSSRSDKVDSRGSDGSLVLLLLLLPPPRVNGVIDVVEDEARRSGK